jgi:hypothetical protein
MLAPVSRIAMSSRFARQTLSAGLALSADMAASQEAATQRASREIEQARFSTFENAADQICFGCNGRQSSPSEIAGASRLSNKSGKSGPPAILAGQFDVSRRRGKAMVSFRARGSPEVTDWH